MLKALSELQNALKGRNPHKNKSNSPPKKEIDEPRLMNIHKKINMALGLMHARTDLKQDPIALVNRIEEDLDIILSKYKRMEERLESAEEFNKMFVQKLSKLDSENYGSRIEELYKNMGKKRVKSE